MYIWRGFTIWRSRGVHIVFAMMSNVDILIFAFDVCDKVLVTDRKLFLEQVTQNKKQRNVNQFVKYEAAKYE